MSDYVGPLKGINFCSTGLSERRYTELLAELNEKLYIPYGGNLGVFWFTQKGLDTFGPCMRRFINALETEGSHPVYSARLVYAEINSNDSTFCDSYQLASTRQYNTRVVERF